MFIQPLWYNQARSDLQASNQSLKQRCFFLWRENSRAQAARTGRRVQGFTQRQQETRLCRAFLDWRRHMHSTLVSRYATSGLLKKSRGRMVLLVTEIKDLERKVKQNFELVLKSVSGYNPGRFL